jgi:hypothetical protein
VERLVQEWHPSQEPAGEGCFAPGVSPAVEAPSVPVREEPTEELRPGQLSHDLYFRTQKEGQGVATELRRQGFEVVSRKKCG